MPAVHYRFLSLLGASLSLLAACSLQPVTYSLTEKAAPPAAGLVPAAQGTAPAAAANAAAAGLRDTSQHPAIKTAAADKPDDIDTEATIWTVLGFAKKPSYHAPGPRTGNTVSPILWQAALDTLSFVKFSTEDPLTGELVTEWYSPKGKPDERFKIDVFVLARTVRSDAVAVTIQRQERTATGEWKETTIARQVEDDLETAILRRAGQLKREWKKAYAEK